MTSAPWERKDTLLSASLAGLACLLRTVLALMTPVIGADSQSFLLFAAEIDRGLWVHGLNECIQPAYPVAIHLFSTLLGNVETAAVVVSILFSSLSVVVFYALVRDIAGRAAAVVSGLLYACHHYFLLEQSDVMTEGFFHFWFLLSVTLSWLASRRASWSLYLMAGLSGGIAYLTRVEGVYAVVALAGAAAFAMIRERKKESRFLVPAAAGAALGLFAALLVSWPLLVHYRAVTGRWTISRRISVEKVGEVVKGPDGATAPDSAPFHGWGAALGKFATQVLRSTLWILLPLILAGAILARRFADCWGSLYLGCLSVGYCLAPIAAAAGGYPLSHRYILVGVLFALPFAAIAGLRLPLALRRILPPRPSEVLPAALLVVFLLMSAGRALHPRRAEELPMKEASLWLKPRLSADARVHANNPKVGHYLGVRTEALPHDPDELDLRAGEYLLVNEPQLLASTPGSLERFETRFRRIARFPAEPRDGLDRVSIFTMR